MPGLRSKNKKIEKLQRTEFFKLAGQEKTAIRRFSTVNIYARR